MDRASYARQIVERDVSSLKPYARTHSKKQLQQIAASIERFGFVNPVPIADDDSIIAGHGRVEAAKLLGHKSVPTLSLSHLSYTERRAYILADNKLALNDDFDVDLTGFSIAEVDFIIDDADSANADTGDPKDDELPDMAGPAVTRMGDL